MENFDKKEVYSHYSQKVMMLFYSVCSIDEAKLEENIRNKKLPKSIAKFGADIRADIAAGRKKAEYDFEKNELTIFKRSKDEKDSWWTRQKDRVNKAQWLATGGKVREESV